MSIKLTSEQIEGIAEELIGTTKDLDRYLEEHGLPPSDQIDTDSLTELDSQVFLCSSCGWWYSADDCAIYDLCYECEDDDEQEDEEDDE